MKYCSHCGKEIDDSTIVCPYCGCQIAELMQTQPTETSTLGTLAIVFSILGGALGLILAIIGLCTYKLEENRKKCKIALGILVAEIIFFVIIMLAL